MTPSERAREAERLRREFYDLAIKVYYVSRNGNMYGIPPQKYLKRMENCRKMLDRIVKRLEFFVNKTD